MEVVSGLVGIPLSVEVIVGVLVKCLIPLSVEVIEVVVWLSAHPSKCRGDLCCVLPLV